MSSTKLIDLTAKILASGMFPSAEAASGAVWKTGANVWFRELSIESMLNRQKIVLSISRESQALAQCLTTTKVKRLYYEDLGIINRYEGAAPIVIGTLDSAGDYDLEPWGDWLFATDNVGGLKYWTGTGTFATPGDVNSNFARCKIIKKLAQHLIAYNTDLLPTGFHWCTANDPTTWTPGLNNSARNLNIRNLDSEIIAVCDLGAAHAVYSSNSMLVNQYLGPTQWFGTPNQALIGIGAAGKHAVVGLGRYNFGLSRAGIWTTDGSSYTYIDRPAIDKWIQENVDWDRASSICGFYNEKLGLIIFTVPLLTGGRTAIAVDPKLRQATTESIYLGQKIFTYLDNDIGFGIEKNVFSNPITALSDGIYLESLAGTVEPEFALTSHLFDAAAPDYYKLWDYAIFPGTFGADAQVRFGFADVPDESAISWGSWTRVGSRVPLPDGPRESVYLALDFKSTTLFRMSGAFVYGEKAGQIS